MNQAFNLSSFGEQMLVHENSMVKIDDDIPLDRRPRRLRRDDRGRRGVNAAKVEPGATVAVIGCGGVGLPPSTARRSPARSGSSRSTGFPRSSKSPARWRNGREQCRCGGAGPRDDQGGVHYSFEALGTKATAEQPFRCCAQAAPRRSSAWYRSA